ncbi:MAG: hypothetical protein WAS21_02205 [Geminicoccaceae bacterium]
MASDVGVRAPVLSNVVNVAPGKRAASAGNSEGDAWADGWRRNEFSYLRDRVEVLERQLRRRTAILGTALVLSLGLAAGLAVVTFVDAPWTAWARNNLTGEAAGSADQPATAPVRPRLRGEVTPDAG